MKGEWVVKRVFVPCTGRCGSLTFVKACEHFTNFTAGHETLSLQHGKRTDARYWEMDYPAYHIEADSRLAWMLGALDHKYRDHETYYIHLVRPKDEVVRSRMLRLKRGWGNLSRLFAKLFYVDPEKIDEEVLGGLYDITVQNIEAFIAHKPNSMTVRLGPNVKRDFRRFCRAVGAEGDIEAAVAEWDTKHHQSPELVDS